MITLHGPNYQNVSPAPPFFSSGNGVAIGGAGAGGSVSGLLAQATAYFDGIAPRDWIDFAGNRALFNSQDVGAVVNTPGYSLTRATVGTAETLAGQIVQFAAGELRRTDRGVLLEAARTNLFLNSAVGVTQDVTVAAVEHTLSFRGTGTITLTGASTAGPLVGTGANNRVSLTFTSLAGLLTLTITGSCTNVQLEAGPFASSWIPTAGASVTRDADILNITSVGGNYPTTLYVEGVRTIDTAAAEALTRLDAGTDDDRMAVSINNVDLARVNVFAATVSQADITAGAAIPAGAAYKIASCVATNRTQICRDGALGVEDTLVTVPAAPTTWRIGVTAISGSQPFGYIRNVARFNFALSDAQLQAITL